MNVRRFVATAVAAAAVFGPGVAMSSPAAAADVEYVPGKDITIGSCKGWLNKRTSDGYIQAVGQSWGDDCDFWLQRKRLGEGGYDWTIVSNRYSIQNSTAATGFHWNGTNAGSRVCVHNYGNTYGVVCGDAIW